MVSAMSRRCSICMGKKLPPSFTISFLATGMPPMVSKACTGCGLGRRRKEKRHVRIYRLRLHMARVIIKIYKISQLWGRRFSGNKQAHCRPKSYVPLVLRPVKKFCAAPSWLHTPAGSIPILALMAKISHEKMTILIVVLYL